MTIGFDLDHDLHLEFSRSNVKFDLEYSRSNVEFAVTQPKMLWLPWSQKQTYRFNSDVTIGIDLSCDLDLKYLICYILWQNDLIAMKQKKKALNVTLKFDLVHDLDLGFSRSNF